MTTTDPATLVELLYFEGCPNWREAELRLRVALRQAGLAEDVLTLQQVGSPEQAERLRFRGSPTVLINGVDPFADPDGSVGLACRLYRAASGLEGSPSVIELVAALRARHAAPPAGSESCTCER